MHVILLQDVKKLGHKYQVKKVADGYALNHLIPQQLAEAATGKKLKQLEKMIETHAQQATVQAELLEKNLESLGKAQIEISTKANDQGHLFSGIHEADLVLALKEQARIDLKESMIQLDEPIKAVGDFNIRVSVGDVQGSFSLSVKNET